jgi:hypothetical protein
MKTKSMSLLEMASVTREQVEETTVPTASLRLATTSPIRDTPHLQHSAFLTKRAAEGKVASRDD